MKLSWLWTYILSAGSPCPSRTLTCPHASLSSAYPPSCHSQCFSPALRLYPSAASANMKFLATALAILLGAEAVAATPVTLRFARAAHGQAPGSAQDSAQDRRRG